MKNLQKKLIYIILILASFVTLSACKNIKESKFIEIYANFPENTSKKGDYTFIFKKGENQKNQLKGFFKSETDPKVVVEDSFYYALIDDKKIYYSIVDHKENKSKIVSVDITTNTKKPIQTYENNSNISLEFLDGDELYFSIWEENEDATGYICTLNKINSQTGQTTRVLNEAVSSKLGINRIFYQKTFQKYIPYKLFASDLQGQNSREVADQVLFYKPIDGKLYYIAIEEKTQLPYLYISSEEQNNPIKSSDAIEGTFFIDLTKTHVIYGRYETENERFAFYEMDIKSGKIEKLPEEDYEKYKQQIL